MLIFFVGILAYCGLFWLQLSLCRFLAGWHFVVTRSQNAVLVVSGQISPDRQFKLNCLTNYSGAIIAYFGGIKGFCILPHTRSPTPQGLWTRGSSQLPTEELPICNGLTCGITQVYGTQILEIIALCRPTSTKAKHRKSLRRDDLLQNQRS